MFTQLPFFGRENELKLILDAWNSTTSTKTPHVITFIAESGVGKSRIIQQFYLQLSNHEYWDPDNFWPNTFQSPSTQLRVNPEFPADFVPNGPPQFLWIGMRWANANERNIANSLALPTLKEQLLAFNQQIKQFQSRWTRMAQALMHGGKEIVRAEEIIKIVAGNLVPFADVAITILSPAIKEGFDYTESTSNLSSQLFELLYVWFNQPQPIPIIFWLDDVQWIDPEARTFFTRLMHTAHHKHWPILLLATSWPKEWNEFDAQFFLKYNNAVQQHLSNAQLNELRELLLEVFPNLPPHHINLLISKAGGNFLTMIENIAQLRTHPRYFINNDIQQPLSVTGEEAIKNWESTREQHIKQRFDTINSELQDFLARASQAGINSQFLHNVLVRYSETHPHIGDVASLLEQCQVALAIVVPISPNVHEFRDRGYFAVAQNHFYQWLLQNESAPLKEALIAELTTQVQSIFDHNNELCEPIEHSISLRTAPISEQRIILELAFAQLPKGNPHAIQALVALCIILTESYAWEELRTRMHDIASINWDQHAHSSIGWRTLEKLADICRETGAIAQAKDINLELLDFHRMQWAQTNTTTTLHQLIDAYIKVGKILVDGSDFHTAEQTFQEAHSFVKSLMTQTIPSDEVRWRTVRLLSDILHYMGDTQLIQSKYTTALAYFEEDLTLSQLLVQERQSVDDIRDLSIAYVAVGNCAMVMGNVSHAQVCYLESSLLKRQIIAKRGTLDDYRILAVTLSRVGRSYSEQGVLNHALLAYQEALSTAKHVVKSRNLLNDQRTYSTTLNAVGRIHFKKGNLAEARTLAKESLTVSRLVAELRGITQDYSRLIGTLFLLGEIEYKCAAYTDALRYFDEALIHAQYLTTLTDVPDSHLDVVVALNFVGECHEFIGDQESALSRFHEALRIWQQHALRHVPKFIIQFIKINNNVANILLHRGDDQQAEALLHDSINACRQLTITQDTPANQIIQLQTETHFSTLMAHRGEITEAIESNLSIITKYKQLSHVTYPAEIQYYITHRYFMLSQLYYQQHDITHALIYAHQAHSCMMQDAYLQTTHMSTSREQLEAWIHKLTHNEQEI